MFYNIILVFTCLYMLELAVLYAIVDDLIVTRKRRVLCYFFVAIIMLIVNMILFSMIT